MNLSSTIRPKMEITKKRLKEVFRTYRDALEKEAEHYGLEVEERIYNKLALILQATTMDEALLFASKAMNSHQVHCLVHGERPKTPEWYDKQAVKARSLQKSMASKGETEEAARHGSRAERYDAEAKKIREQVRE